MADFALPHNHGRHKHDEALHRELMNTERFSAVADVFKQLSDPVRVRIFWLLSHREECVINIAAMMDMSSPAVSHHLKSLLDSGLIMSRRDGKEVYYKASDTEQIGLLHEIVEQVMEITCPEKEVDFQASQEEIIRNVHNYLIEHISERITIETLSREFLMNTTTLKTVFKKVYGTTIAAHMKQHRMELAAGLLLKTQNDIASVAQAVGMRARADLQRRLRRPTASCQRNTDGGTCAGRRSRRVTLVQSVQSASRKILRKLPLKKYFQKSKIIENVWRMCVNPVCVYAPHLF